MKSTYPVPLDTDPPVVPVVWDDGKILAALGPRVEPVRELLARNRQPVPTAWSFYQWTSRKKIPQIWRPRLIYALMREGRLEFKSLLRAERPANDNKSDALTK